MVIVQNQFCNFPSGSNNELSPIMAISFILLAKEMAARCCRMLQDVYVQSVSGCESWYRWAVPRVSRGYMAG